MDVIINCRYYIHSRQCLILMLKLQLRRMLGPTHKFLSKYMARWASQHNYFWIINPEMTSKEGRKYNVLVDTSTVGGVVGCFLSKLTAAEPDHHLWDLSNPCPPPFCCCFFFSFSNLTKAEVNSWLFVRNKNKKQKQKQKQSKDRRSVILRIVYNKNTLGYTHARQSQSPLG